MAARTRKEAWIAHGGDDIIVAGQNPATHELAPMYGVFGAQLMVDRIGIPVERRPAQMFIKRDPPHRLGP